MSYRPMPDEFPAPAGRIDASPHPADAVRSNRLAAIRAMIDDGSYETDERMIAAVERMLCDIVDNP